VSLTRSVYRYVKSLGMRAVAVGALGVGMVALFLGWLGVSGATLPTEQLPYVVSGAVAGLFLLGVAATLWLSADLRDEFQRLGEIKQLLADEPPPSRNSDQ
jgi:ABC-type Na+ efflux pump permease subunit